MQPRRGDPERDDERVAIRCLKYNNLLMRGMLFNRRQICQWVIIICSVISCSDPLEQYREWTTKESDRKISLNLNGQDYSRTFSNGEDCIVQYSWDEKKGYTLGELYIHYGLSAISAGVLIPRDEESNLCFDFMFASDEPFPVNEYFDFNNNNTLYFSFDGVLDLEEQSIIGRMRIKEINKAKKKVKLEFIIEIIRGEQVDRVQEGILYASLNLRGKAKELFN